MLWYCWLGVRKRIWPVDIVWWCVGVVICLERGVDCLHMVQLMPLHPRTPSSLASFKFTLILPFWYRLSQVFLEKRPLNGWSSSSTYLLPSHRASLHFGRHSFLIRCRVGGWIGLGSWLRTEVVCPPASSDLQGITSTRSDPHLRCFAVFCGFFPHCIHWTNYHVGYQR